LTWGTKYEAKRDSRKIRRRNWKLEKKRPFLMVMLKADPRPMKKHSPFWECFFNRLGPVGHQWLRNLSEQQKSSPIFRNCLDLFVS
jgi:hypothetical protein